MTHLARLVLVAGLVALPVVRAAAIDGPALPVAPFAAAAFPVPVLALAAVCSPEDPYCLGNVVNCEDSGPYQPGETCYGYDGSDYLECYCEAWPGGGGGSGGAWICHPLMMGGAPDPVSTAATRFPFRPTGH